jgi:uncharacterized protein YkvS
MNNRVEEATRLIHSMDSQEIEQIVTEVKQRRTRLARQTVRSITIGDTAEFTTSIGRRVQGKVTKVNRKTVIVHESGYGNWKVPASLLTRVDTATA